MRNRTQEKYLKISVFVITLVMIILRFLLNEKGRVSPDSIRFFRGAHVFPIIDNTTTPLGYPLSIKLFTLFGFDEFWSSKIIGILAYFFLVFFAWKKKFYLREILLTGALYSFVSIFSFSVSETLILPFVLWFLFVARQIIITEIVGAKAILLLTISLILLFNIRYPSLFIIGAVFLYGLLNIKKKYASVFLWASGLGFLFIVLYKFIFIDYYNEKYVATFLEIGLHPTSKLLKELYQGLATTYNPFIHIANPQGGVINIGIYGIGILNIAFMIFLFAKNGISETEKFFIFIGIIGIVCSFFIQYFYSVNPLDYRLMAPFSFPVWLVYFRKLWQVFGQLTYVIPALSLLTGFAFTWLSRGNYLENRKNADAFLVSENLKSKPIDFYIKNDLDLSEIQVAELLSTVNANINLTKKSQDTLKKNTLTKYKVLSKIKIDENKFQ